MKKRFFIGLFCLQWVWLVGIHSDHRIDALKIFWDTKINVLKNSYFYPDTDKESWVANSSVVARSQELRITWIGHSTFLIQVGLVNIITDPIFFDLSFLYPRTFKVDIEKLPKIDLIIISHNHRDHMDAKSLMLLKSHDPKVIIPSGMMGWFTERGFNVAETTWGQTATLDRINVTSLPANHWSGRGLSDYNKASYSSYMITANGSNIYFAGDTAKGEHFREIGQKYNVDVALLPIGPNEPANLLRFSHLSSEEAGEAFCQLNAKTFIPMHWGTFRLGTDHFDDPIRMLNKWWQKNQDRLVGKSLRIVKFGGTVTGFKPYHK